MAVNKGITERINLLVERHTKGNYSKFADIIDISKSAFSKICRGEVEPRLSTLRSILERFPDTNGSWLILGNPNENSQKGHSNLLLEPQESYGENDLIEIMKKQFGIKDDQIKNQANQINQLIKKIK